MLRIKSIKRFLIFGILGSLTLVWLLSALHIYHESQEQVEELFDAELAQMARILQSVINANISSKAQTKSLSYLDIDVISGVFGDEEYTELGHKYEQKLAFQVWDASGKLFFENHLGLPESSQDLASGFTTLVGDGYYWRSFTIQDKTGGFWIRTSQREDVRSELTNEIANDTVTPILIIIPALFVLLGLIINKGLSPLRDISNALKARDHKNLEHIAPDTFPRELDTMLRELNSLFSRVSNAYERERRFTADAAHELRTPLAISKVHLQNIQDTTKETNTQNFVAKALTGIDRLIHMVQQLLILSRLEAGQESEEKTLLEVGQIVEEVCSDLKQVPELATTDIVIVKSTSPHWSFNEAQLRIILRNLVDNAARYAFDDSVVTLSIKPNAIEICNHCAELSPEQLTHLSDRFTRGFSGKKGSGLGLSICQQICTLNNLTMDISNRTDDTSGIKTCISGFV